MSRVLIVLIACGKKEIAVKNAARYPKATNSIIAVSSLPIFVLVVTFYLIVYLSNNLRNPPKQQIHKML